MALSFHLKLHFAPFMRLQEVRAGFCQRPSAEFLRLLMGLDGLAPSLEAFALTLPEVEQTLLGTSLSFLECLSRLGRWSRGRTLHA